MYAYLVDEVVSCLAQLVASAALLYACALPCSRLQGLALLSQVYAASFCVRSFPSPLLQKSS